MWTHRVVSSTTIRITGLLLTLGFGMAAVAAEKEAFVVLPDGGGHYTGPRQANTWMYRPRWWYVGHPDWPEITREFERGMLSVKPRRA